MKRGDEYTIQYPGLSLGRHEFDWKIEDKFFEALDYSEIKKGNVDVKVILEKKSSFMELNFEISGKIELECDRCTVDFYHQIESSERLIVKFWVSSEEEEDENEEIIVLSKNQNELNLTTQLYEYIAVQAPIRRVGCELDGDESLCNQEVLNMISNLSSSSDDKPTDPRWDKLSGLDLN